MRIRLAGLVAVALLAIAAAPAAKAQTTDTQTNCSIYGNTANCNSTSTTNPGPDPEAMRKAGEGMGTAIGTIVARNRAMKQAKAGVETRVVYCQQNSEGYVTTDTGERKTCTDELAYVKAACTVAKNKQLKSICQDTGFAWGKPKAVKQ
jgi:hypothetical protein